MRTTYKKWLANFVVGTFDQTTRENVTSTSRPLIDADPQSAILFQPAAPLISASYYADDLIIISLHSKHTQAAQSLQTYLRSLALWISLNRTIVFPHRSSVTLSLS